MDGLYVAMFFAVVGVTTYAGTVAIKHSKHRALAKRARVISALAMLAKREGDNTTARKLWDEAGELWREYRRVDPPSLNPLRWFS